METRRWLFIALLAVACVSLIRAQETSGGPSGSSEPSGSGGPSGSSEPSGSVEPSGSSEPSESGGPSGSSEPSGSGGPSGSSEPSGSGEPLGSSEPSGSGGPWGSSEAWGRGEGGVALRAGGSGDEGDKEPSEATDSTSTATGSSTENDATAANDTSPANGTSTEEPEGPETVTKKDFDIIGVQMKSYLGRNFNAFCGIPYAEAPIGLRRFKNPVPMTYDGTIDATKCEDTPVCMQIRWHRGENKVIGAEDCLFLNVYEPEAASANMPVIVYFHGGGFFSGSGTFNDAGPHYFMDRDVVLVTVNYRLGPLGFFSLNDREAPGNMGLTDQVLALQWVKKYIRHFHGDRFRVTIMGEGAGGASVHLHLLSSMSRGLFSRAISQSGVALNSWALVKDMVNISRTHAGILGCKKIRDASTMKCMREIEAEKILNYSRGLHAYNTDPLVVYGPMVQEGKFGKDIFLRKHPMDLLLQGSFYNVPWLVGCVNTPGFFRAERYLKDKTMMKNLTKDFEKNGSVLLDLDLSIEDPIKRQEIVKQTKDAYENFTGSFNGSAVLQMFGDRDFNLGHMLSVAYHALLYHEHLYQYRFDYRGMHSMAENVTLVKPDEVVNEDELIYLLKRPSLFPDFDRTVVEGKRDFQMMRMLTGIWAQFAATGEVKAPYRSKRAAVAPTDTGGTGLFAELFNRIFSSHRRARREDAATETRGTGPLSKLFSRIFSSHRRDRREDAATDTRGTGPLTKYFSRIFSSHRRARRDNAVTQSSVDVAKVKQSANRVRRGRAKQTTSSVRRGTGKPTPSWARRATGNPTPSSVTQVVGNTTVGSNGGNASKPVDRPSRTWEEFLDLTWKNKSTCWDNYNATRWPAVKRFSDTPGNVATLPYLSFMKGGNDTPVTYCLRNLMEIDRMNHWLQLPLDEVKLPDVFMNLITTTSAPAKEITVTKMTKQHCPTWRWGGSTEWPDWGGSTEWPNWEKPTEWPDWGETTKWPDWGGSTEWPDWERPTEWPDWGETTEWPDWGGSTEWPDWERPTEWPDWGETTKWPDWGESTEWPDWERPTEWPDWGETTKWPDWGGSTEWPDWERPTEWPDWGETTKWPDWGGSTEWPDWERPTEWPDWGETTKWPDWGGSTEWPDWERPTEWPDWGETTDSDLDYTRYTWPPYPKPPEPSPPTFPPVKINLPPLTTRRPHYPRGVRPKLPSRPSGPRQYFTWPITTTTVPAKAPVAQRPAPRPKPKPRPRPKPPRPKARSRAPRSCEVWSFSSLLLLLLLVIQF